ncbi:replication initiation protein [Kineococcus sp. SYSU DK004]|uniref:replication initiation protein n=1 Tax=Kineococcus sp. SYSU DK004 TaxID=3383125 RepID=UPI003D7DEC41
MSGAPSVRKDAPMGAQAWTEAWSPRRPLATDDLSRGCWRQSRDDALARRYLEHSPKALLSMLVIDVDHEDTLIRALQRPRTHPMPSWIAESPSGRGHVGWVLKTPVVRTDAGRMQPMRFAAKVEEGLRRSLDGDVGFAGLLTKNPVHDDWVTTWGSGHLYELGELAKGLGELMPRTLPRRVVDCSGFSRNVALFNRLRLWAYRARRRYSDQREWEQVVAAFAVNVNPEFAVPLPAQEVAQTAQSVARWVWRRSFDEAGFRAVQVKRGSNGGKKGGRANSPAQLEQRRRNAPIASAKGAAARRKVTAAQMAEDLL